MRAQELTIEVNAKVALSDEMAARCLRLLEFWLNDNPDVEIICEKVNTTEGEKHYLRSTQRKGEQP